MKPLAIYRTRTNPNKKYWKKIYYLDNKIRKKDYKTVKMNDNFKKLAAIIKTIIKQDIIT